MFAALASLGAALDDDAMAACLRCVNEECQGDEPHSEICSDCLGARAPTCEPVPHEHNPLYITS